MPLLMSPMDSNPESCRSKQGRDQLSHPSPQPPITLNKSPISLTIMLSVVYGNGNPLDPEPDLISYDGSGSAVYISS